MNSALNQQRCVACEGIGSALTQEQTAALKPQLDADWQISADNKSIFKTFNFTNFYETMAFVNAIAWFSHQENHHPDLTVKYNSCHVLYTTHALGGLTHNDFICAAKVDKLIGLN